jgi:hypothetical protein
VPTFRAASVTGWVRHRELRMFAFSRSEQHS